MSTTPDPTQSLKQTATRLAEEGKANKATLVKEIAKALGKPATTVAPLMDAYLAAIKGALAEGNEAEIRGFGSFRLRRRKKHPARNPHTGETMDVPEHWVVRFKPAKTLRDQVDR